MLQHITHERAPCRIRRGRGATAHWSWFLFRTYILSIFN